MSTDPYRLRTARPDERDRIQEIEDLAGTRSRASASSTSRSTSASPPPNWTG